MSSRRTFLQTAAQLAGALLWSRRLRGSSLSAHAKSPAATTYFIDTAGDNRNAGTSPTQAWADFTNVNGRTLLPGEAVLLRRGCVWHQQLTIQGSGTPDRFVSVGTYGKGDRPKIQRTGNQSDRCIHLQNPSCLRLSSVEVCNGGAGIVLHYDRSYGNHSVYLDDIVAHDFALTGVAREDPHDQVSWAYGIGVTGVDSPGQAQDRVLSDLRITNSEVYRTGAGVALDWGNHRTVNGAMALSNKFGNVLLEHLNLHDNTVDGIAFVSLFLTSVTQCLVRNVVIDKGARYAPTGSAAVQVMYSKGVTFQAVTIRNTAYNACPDNAAIDLECDNEDTVIDGCRFENNAGPAIEILATPGNPNAFARNFVIQNSTFIQNNRAKKIAAAQIAVPNWQRGNAPSGKIVNNTYQNAAGTVFFGGDGDLRHIQVTGNQAIQ